ncbi:HNH endonuclease [Streptosporangium sp. G12]
MRTLGVDNVRSQAWKEFRLLILNRDNWTCQNCGRGPLTGRYAATVDHIKPRAEGGRSTLENCRTLCRRCNTLLGASTGALIAYRKEAEGRPGRAPSLPGPSCRFHAPPRDDCPHSERL